MKHQTIDSKIDYGLDIPSSIESCILRLFGVARIEDINDQEKERIRRVLAGLFSDNSEIDYSVSCREYTLYYLPLNLYKIWRPLMDILYADRLPTKCKILELGSGPGSSTFGLIEFFKYLAYDNHLTEFILELTLVEREHEFIAIFNKLYLDYVKSLPSNLHVDINIKNEDAYKFVQECSGAKYDLIIESNMLNPFEGRSDAILESFVRSLKAIISPHSSVIIIEPAKQSLAVYLKQLKTIMFQQGMHCYSPCCCPNDECARFASARIEVKEIGIYSALVANGFINKALKNHSFEYAVFRNDKLSKYDYEGTGDNLSKLAANVGGKIKFKAFILTFANETEDSFSLKICDGSLCDKSDVWLYIPKSILIEDSINCLTSGRGGLVDVKNAIVEGPQNIKCVMSTQLKIYR